MPLAARAAAATDLFDGTPRSAGEGGRFLIEVTAEREMFGERSSICGEPSQTNEVLQPRPDLRDKHIGEAAAGFAAGSQAAVSAASALLECSMTGGNQASWTRNI